tara:strand:- start:2383 stop:2760 length:378 start_codon:yes stop_codon:yes gene_type:complete
MYAQKVKKQIINKGDTNILPRGWIKLSKGTIYNKVNTTNYDNKKHIHYDEFNTRANKVMDSIVNRFLEYKKEELILENYCDEEINIILENYTNFDNDGYDYYPCDEDFDSDNENSDSDLSDIEVY